MRAPLKNISKLLFFVLLGACSIAEDDPNEGTVADGAVQILDAADPFGTNSAPTGACTPSTWNDSSDESNNGSLINCSTGWLGNGDDSNPYRLSFNGSNQYVSTALNMAPNEATSSTWMAWLKPGRLNHSDIQQILSTDTMGGQNHRSIFIQASSSNFGVFTGESGVQTWEPGAVATTTDWHFIAVVFTPSNIIFYKDGVAYSRGIAPTFASSGGALNVGSNLGVGAQEFQGDIAWTAIYAQQLTESEIWSTCRALRSRFGTPNCDL